MNSQNDMVIKQMMVLKTVPALLALLIVPLFAASPIITQTAAPIPASLSVFASAGDLTYCVAVVQASTIQFTLSCRKNGVTQFTSTVIISSTVISSGDLCWVINYDPIKLNVVHVQVAENLRTAGQITSTIIGSQFDATWPNGTPTVKHK